VWCLCGRASSPTNANLAGHLCAIAGRCGRASKRSGKKGAPSEDGALRKWGKRTREEETPLAVGLSRGRRVRLKSVSMFCGTEGGGVGAASHRQGEYVLVGPIQQCVRWYASYACGAQKVSLFDPICRRPRIAPENNRPCSRGEQGLVLWKANLPQGGNALGEEGMCPARLGYLGPLAKGAQPGPEHVSHAPIACAS
jgi:hypothetical protein